MFLQHEIKSYESYRRCHAWLERSQKELVDIVLPLVADSPKIQEVLKANLLTHLKYVLSGLKNGTLHIPVTVKRFNLQEFPEKVNSDALYDRAFSLLLSHVNSKNHDFTVDGVPVGDDGVKALRHLVGLLAEAYKGSSI